MDDVLSAEALGAHAAHAHAHAQHAGAHMGTHRHGSWGGHVLPGALFLIWGFWWALAASARWHHGARARDAFVARAWWPLAPARTGGWRSLEPRLKAALPALGVVVELYFHPGDLWFRAPMDATGARFEPDNLNNWQHAAMYSAFAFSGLCDLLLPPAASRVLGFASLAQAFSVELLLFWFHLRMQSGLTADVHVLLCFAVAGCAAAVLAEAALVGTGAFAPTVARAFFTLLQGTWFCQAARILFGAAPWDPDDDANSMMLPCVFTAHVLGVGAFMLALFLFIGRQPLLVQLLCRDSHTAQRGVAAAPPTEASPHADVEMFGSAADKRADVLSE